MEVNEDDAWTLLSALFASTQFTQRGIAAHPLDPVTIRLLALAAERGTLRPSDAASELDVAPPTITRHVHALERDGRLVAVADPADGRSYIIEVTEAGHTALKEFREDLVARFRPVLEGFDSQEVHTLALLLSRLADSMGSVAVTARVRAPKNRWAHR
jgi:DNA-binding MarR family transcriptional regulator